MMAQGHFEAKVERRSENAKGIFITLLVNPADHDSALAQVRVGASLMIGWAETVNSAVEPIEPASGNAGHRLPEPPVLATTAAPQSGEETAAPSAKPRKSFSEYPLSAQAGMRCREPQFRRFLATKDGPSDFAMFDLDMAEDDVRDFCGVKSRADLDKHPGGALRWRELETQFQSWLATQMHAEHYR